MGHNWHLLHWVWVSSGSIILSYVATIMSTDMHLGTRHPTRLTKLEQCLLVEEDIEARYVLINCK